MRRTRLTRPVLLLGLALMAISQVTSGSLTTLKHDLHRQQLVQQLSRDFSQPEEALLPGPSLPLPIRNTQSTGNSGKNIFEPGAVLDLSNHTAMPRERYFNPNEEGRRHEVKQRKSFEDASGFQGFAGAVELSSHPRLHEAAKLDRKYDTLYPADVGVNAAEKCESSVLPARALYNGFAEQVFGHPNPHAPQVAGTLGYPCVDGRLPPTALTLSSPEMTGPRSLKTMDPLTLSRILLDQQVVAMAQMRQLRLLQQSYIASGSPLYLLPENLVQPADLEVLWHLKHPGLPLPPAWTTLPWLQDDAGAGAADLRPKDMRRYQDHLKYSKREQPGVDPGGLPPVDAMDRARFMRDGIEASEMARTAADLLPGSDCHSKEKKCREANTFLENEKLGFSVDRMKRDRRWWKVEAKAGISDHHPHQQNWLEAGATEPASRLQRNFVVPGFRQSDRKPETGRNGEVGCTSDYRKFDWPDGRAPANQERARKPSENDTPDPLQAGHPRPSSDPHLRNSDIGLHPRNTGYAFSDRMGDFFSERVNDGQPLPPPDWFSSMERANQHAKSVGQFPVGGYKGRTSYRHSQEYVPTDIAHKSPTIPEAMLQRGSNEMKMLSSAKNSRHPFYPQSRHSNGATNGASLESREGIGPETGCGFMSPQNGAARDLFLQQAALRRFSASEVQKPVTHENLVMRDDWEKTDVSQKRYYHKIPSNVPYDFPGIPYSGPGGPVGRYSTFLDGLSTGPVCGGAVSSPTNAHYIYSHGAPASRLQMPSLSPIIPCEVLQSRRAHRWAEGIISSRNTKKLKLDLPRATANSPLPSWMNKSTFSALSTNSIDSFKSFVDHTVQNAFINEMKEAESCATAKADEARQKSEKALEDRAADNSTLSRNGEETPVTNSVVLTGSGTDGLASHPLSAEMTPDSLAPEGTPCRQETPMSAGSDSGLPPQLGETGAHTKFKKTWLLNYLDEDRKLGSDSGAECHQSPDAESFPSKDNGDHESNGMDDESEEPILNGNTQSAVELIDLSSTKKLSQA